MIQNCDICYESGLETKKYCNCNVRICEQCKSLIYFCPACRKLYKDKHNIKELSFCAIIIGIISVTIIWPNMGVEYMPGNYDVFMSLEKYRFAFYKYPTIVYNKTLVDVIKKNLTMRLFHEYVKNSDAIDEYQKALRELEKLIEKINNTKEKIDWYGKIVNNIKNIENEINSIKKFERTAGAKIMHKIKKGSMIFLLLIMLIIYYIFLYIYDLCYDGMYY